MKAVPTAVTKCVCLRFGFHSDHLTLRLRLQSVERAIHLIDDGVHEKFHERDVLLAIALVPATVIRYKGFMLRTKQAPFPRHILHNPTSPTIPQSHNPTAPPPHHPTTSLIHFSTSPLPLSPFSSSSSLLLFSLLNNAHDFRLRSRQQSRLPSRIQISNDYGFAATRFLRLI